MAIRATTWLTLCRTSASEKVSFSELLARLQAMKSPDFSELKAPESSFVYGVVTKGSVVYMPLGYILLESVVNNCAVKGLRLSLVWSDKDLVEDLRLVSSLLNPAGDAPHTVRDTFIAALDKKLSPKVALTAAPVVPVPVAPVAPARAAAAAAAEPKAAAKAKGK